jgi:O-antigen/teichoic acid export membrane protein
MNKSRRAILTLSWHSVAYGVGVLGSQLIVYVLLPFLTRYMPREEYGVVSVMTALYGFLNMLTNAGLPAATFRFFNNAEAEDDKRLTLGGSQLLFFLFASIPAFLIVLFPKPISMLLLESEHYALALQMLAGYLIFDSMNNYGSIILRIQTRALTSSFHSIFLLACKIGLALLFVIGYDMGVAGYWLGYLIGEALGFAIMMWLIRERLSFHISWDKLKDLMRFGVPLIPASLSMTALRMADRYIIGALAGLEQVAVYDIGYKVGTIILLVIAPFRIAWNPFAFSIAKKPEAPKIFKDVLTYLMAICIFLALGIFAFRSLLIQILAPASYSGAEEVVGWVLLSQLFYASYYVFSKGSMINNKTHQLVFGAVAAGVTNIALNYLLIPVMGIAGAAIATLAGYAVLSTLAYLIGWQSFEMRPDWGRLGKLALAGGIVILLISAVEALSVAEWAGMALKAVVLTAFPILLIGFRFIKPSQFNELRELGKSMINKKRGQKDEPMDTV